MSALVDVIRFTDGEAEVHIDCLPVLRQALKLQEGWKPGPKTANGDLWGEAAYYLPLRQGTLVLKKIKAHITRDQAAQEGYSLQGWEVNQLADTLAGEAAAAHQVPEGVAWQVQHTDQKAELVLERLQLVHAHILSLHKPDKKVPRPPRLTAKEKVQMVVSGTGHGLQFKKYVRCVHCMQSSTYRAAHRVFAQKCPGVAAGLGHNIQVYKGLRLCTTCGAYSSDGFARRNLAKECKPKRTGEGARALKHIKAGYLPEQLPNGAWPDGTPGRRKPGLKEYSAVDIRVAKAKAKAEARVSARAVTGASSLGKPKGKARASSSVGPTINPDLVNPSKRRRTDS